MKTITKRMATTLLVASIAVSGLTVGASPARHGRYNQSSQRYTQAERQTRWEEDFSWYEEQLKQDIEDGYLTQKEADELLRNAKETGYCPRYNDQGSYGCGGGGHRGMGHHRSYR